MRDMDIRVTLLHELAIAFRDDPETVIIDELGILRGSARVDVAVVNGELHGYEIKSPRDTLARLPKQVELYDEVFDRMTLVVSDPHRCQAVSTIPDWWQVMLASEGPQGVRLSILREGSANPHVLPRSVAELLWRDEALEMLAARHADRGYRSKPRWEIWDRLCEVYSEDEIRDAVRARLRVRAAAAAAQSSE